MKKTQHTLGPWRAGAGEKVWVFGEGYAVALMTGGEVIRDKANAHLIAAAPDLLESMQCLIDVLQLSWSDSDRMIPEYQSAIDAIAKAMGEE